MYLYSFMTFLNLLKSHSREIERTQQPPMRYSKSFLRKSTSSFDLQFSFVKGQLGPVKEMEDEDLTIPFEPKEHLIHVESQDSTVKDDTTTVDGG